MTRRDPPARELQDKDIQALMDAQAPTGSPADLDERIRHQAHAAVGEATPVTKPQNPVRSRTARMGSWMAVAALMVLTVLLVPLLPTTDSEPTLNSVAVEPGTETEIIQSRRRAQTEATLAADATSVQEDVAVRSVMENSAAGIATAPSTVVPIEQAKSQQAARLRADDTESSLTPESFELKGLTGDKFAALPPVEALSDEDIRATFDTHPYRRAESSWRSEIQRLHNADRTLQVVREVRLFERIYPGRSSGLPGGER